MASGHPSRGCHPANICTFVPQTSDHPGQGAAGGSKQSGREPSQADSGRWSRTLGSNMAVYGLAGASENICPVDFTGAERQREKSTAGWRHPKVVAKAGRGVRSLPSLKTLHQKWNNVSNIDVD